MLHCRNSVQNTTEDRRALQYTKVLIIVIQLPQLYHSHISEKICDQGKWKNVLYIPGKVLKIRMKIKDSQKDDRKSNNHRI